MVPSTTVSSGGSSATGICLQGCPGSQEDVTVFFRNGLGKTVWYEFVAAASTPYTLEMDLTVVFLLQHVVAVQVTLNVNSVSSMCRKVVVFPVNFCMGLVSTKPLLLRLATQRHLSLTSSPQSMTKTRVCRGMFIAVIYKEQFRAFAVAVSCCGTLTSQRAQLRR